MKKILVIGSLGQIGTELTTELRRIHGSSNVVASDIKLIRYSLIQEGPFEILDCTNRREIEDVVKKYRINVIYNLAALLSASAELYPQKAFEVNLMGLFNVLEVAREHKCAVFTPSTIGAFGSTSPKIKTPQETIMRPNTMYGVTKLSGELLSDYYFTRFGVDTRGIRYPGIISYKTSPGGGTTDYAVDIFNKALKEKHYESYIKGGTFLDMMYMPDAIKAAIQIMETDPKKLRYRNAFNITAMSLDVEMLAGEIRKHIPEFTLSYNIDPVRQKIADSWPDSLDDSAAREQWNWAPDYDLAKMTTDMITNLQ